MTAATDTEREAIRVQLCELRAERKCFEVRGWDSRKRYDDITAEIDGLLDRLSALE